METITEVEGYKNLKADIESGVLEELYKIEEKVVLGYTLADAIREGSRYTGQAYGTYVDAPNNKVCALSAAAISVKARFG